MTSRDTSSGVYSPSLTPVSSVNSVSIPYDGSLIWTRIGNVVTVNGIVQVTPQAGNNVHSTFDMELPFPVASGQAGRLSGVGSMVDGNSAGPVSIMKTGDQARFDLASLNVGAVDVSFTFSYLVA